MTVRSFAVVVASTALLVGCTGGGADTLASSGASPSAPSSTASPPETVPFAPGDITVDAKGHVYASDCGGGYVFRVSPTGSVTVVAGIGISSFAGGLSGDGGPATKAQLACPAGLVFDGDGDLLVADHANNRIRSIDTEGIIETVAGNGPLGTAAEGGDLTGDGGPALEATLQEPVGIAFDADGALLVADRDHHAIRSIAPDGTITTIAGTGEQSYSGDGGPAEDATFVSPVYVVPDASGNLYVADDEAGVIRRIDTSGTITTFAGTGEIGYSGDGGPAIEATFGAPEGLAFDEAGNLFVADLDNHVIRMIDRGGIVQTVFGPGEPGCPSGDPDVDPRAAPLSDPSGLVFDEAGNLFVADGTCGVIRIGRDGALVVLAPAVF